MSQVLLHATVLRLLKVAEKHSPAWFSFIGTKVKVLLSSKFYETSPKDAGVVLGEDSKQPGWVIVSFAPINGRQIEFRQRYRVGRPEIDDGVCDLEPDEAEKVSAAVINIGGQLLEIPVKGLMVSPGDILRLERESLNVVGVEPANPSGEMVFVTQIINPETVTVQAQSGLRTVSTGKFAGKLEVNGRVVLDASLAVVVQNFGLEDGSFSVDQKEKLVRWSDICGQEAAKKKLQEAVEGIITHPDHYAYYKRKAVKGILLFGPPGCSKTMFGKAVYASIVESGLNRGVNPSQGFILVKGPELLNKYVGVGEAYIRHIFARARKFKAQYGMPAVIFMDECEAVLAKRDSGISSDVLRTMVPAILAEMDGVVESGALVILATNKPELLDYAVVREGRIDEKIYIGRPDKAAAKQIFLLNMKGVPVKGNTPEQLADIAVEKLFSPALTIFKIKRQDKMEEMFFTMADIVNGAMFPAIVEEAKSSALNRDLKNVTPSDGVTEEDVINAVTSLYQQNFAFDHTEALRDFTQNFADLVTSIEKQKQVKV